MDKIKPIVLYYKDSLKQPLIPGFGVYVYPINHLSSRVTNTKLVFTSPIVSSNIDGSFETENSKYIPYELDETLYYLSN